jgi:hypothetical protein
MVDDILKQLSPQFHKMYAKVGRPSISPQQLLRAQPLQILTPLPAREVGVCHDRAWKHRKRP